MNKTLRYVSTPVIAVLLLLSAGTLTGCGIGAIDNTPAEPQTVQTEISGVVHGGQSPISGATVQLWETSTSTYGGSVGTHLVASTTTAITTGAFTFGTANVPGNCTTGPFAYITVTGGDATGATTSTTNTGILLMAMLGSCSTTGSSTFVVVNELSTIAAAYALSGFATDTSGVISIGAPTSNTQGLADAVANAALLVTPYSNSTTTGLGVANTSTSTMLLPTAMLNTLGNSLAACVNTASTAVALSTGCSNLYTYTTPPGGTAPADTFQAALNMAKYPGANVANILALGVPQAAFAPTVPTTTVTTSSAPNDLTLGIAYLNSTLATATTAPVAVAIDKNDNVWVIGASTTAAGNYIAELSSASAGASYSSNAQSGMPSGSNARWGAFDKSNNLWLSDGGNLQVWNGGNTTPVAQSFSSLSTNTGGSSTLDPNNYVLAVDASGNVFTSTYGAAGNCIPATATTPSANVCDVVELPGGVAASATDTFSSNYTNAPSVRGMFADANTNTNESSFKGNIWLTNYGVLSATKGGTTTPGNTVEILTPGTGALKSVTVGPSGAALWGVALDNTSSAYVVASTIPGLYYVPQNSSSSTTISSSVNVASPPSSISNTTSSPASSATAAVAIGGLNTAANVAVDGAGNVFVANQGYGTVVEYSPSYNSNAGAYISPYYGFSPSISTPSLTASVTKYAVASGIITFTAGNDFAPGDQVTLFGFTSSNSSLNGLVLTVLPTSLSATKFTAAYSGSLTGATTTGTATAVASTQSIFTCTTVSTTTTCAAGPAGIQNSNVAVGIDRAGSIWTLDGKGTLLEIIGTAAPTDPVLADGSYGVKP